MHLIQIPYANSLAKRARRPNKLTKSCVSMPSPRATVKRGKDGQRLSREEKLVVTFVFVSGTNSKEHTAAVTVDQERSRLRVAPKYSIPPLEKSHVFVDLLESAIYLPVPKEKVGLK